MMELKELLSEKSSIIQKRWINAVIETYSPETASFLKKQKNQFANPVGEAISQGIKGIFRSLLGEASTEDSRPFLDRIIRLRAIQDFTPSQAVGFIFLPRHIVRDVLSEEIRKNDLHEDLLRFDSMIDDLAAMAFDIFMQCREKLYEIKANELNRWTYKIIENANVLKDRPNEDTQS